MYQVGVCVLVLVGALVKKAGGIDVSNGTSCEVPLEIPANHHMCFWTTMRKVVVSYRQETREVQVLTRPCPSCFPVTRPINMTYQVPEYGQVCSLKQLWRVPRPIRDTTPDIRILTTPGLLRNKKYPHRILCIWNIKCRDNTFIYLNATQHSTQGGLVEQNQDGRLCPDYIQVKYGNSSLQSCGSAPHQMLVNQVMRNEIQVVFRSDERISGDGFRLDTVCFQPTVSQPQSAADLQGRTLTDVTCTPTDLHFSKAVSEGEEEVIRQAFQVNFDLLVAADACSRSVEKCAHMDFKYLAAVIEQTALVISKHRTACNPIVRSVVTRTLELISQ